MSVCICVCVLFPFYLPNESKAKTFRFSSFHFLNENEQQFAIILSLILYCCLCFHFPFVQMFHVVYFSQKQGNIVRLCANGVPSNNIHLLIDHRRFGNWMVKALCQWNPKYIFFVLVRPIVVGMIVLVKKEKKKKKHQQKISKSHNGMAPLRVMQHRSALQVFLSLNFFR